MPVRPPLRAELTWRSTFHLQRGVRGFTDDRAVVFDEGLNLRVQIGIEPMGLGDLGLEIVDDERLSYPIPSSRSRSPDIG